MGTKWLFRDDRHVLEQRSVLGFKHGLLSSLRVISVGNGSSTKATFSQKAYLLQVVGELAGVGVPPTHPAYLLLFCRFCEAVTVPGLFTSRTFFLPGTAKQRAAEMLASC